VTVGLLGVVRAVKEVVLDEWEVYCWVGWLMKGIGFRYFHMVHSPKLRNIAELIDKRLKLEAPDLYIALYNHQVERHTLYEFYLKSFGLFSKLGDL